MKNYVNSVLKESDNELSKKLWAECPDGCSFDITYVMQVNKHNCSGDLNLKVLCTHEARTSFFIPIYDKVSINYQGEAKCI